MFQKGSSAHPGDLLRVMQRYIHPRHSDIGVACTRFGQAPRDALGIAPMGTVWVAPPGVYYNHGSWLSVNEQEREWLFAIPQNEVPYETIKTAEWDEDMTRWKNGEMKRGWKIIIQDLVTAGHLRNHPDLERLVGYRLSPNRKWDIL